MFNEMMKKKSGGHWAKNINAKKWIKPEEYENLTIITEYKQQTS